MRTIVKHSFIATPGPPPLFVDTEVTFSGGDSDNKERGRLHEHSRRIAMDAADPSSRAAPFQKYRPTLRAATVSAASSNPEYPNNQPGGASKTRCMPVLEAGKLSAPPLACASARSSRPVVPDRFRACVAGA